MKDFSSFLPLRLFKYAAWYPSEMPAPWVKLLTLDSVIKMYLPCELLTPTKMIVLWKTGGTSNNAMLRVPFDPHLWCLLLLDFLILPLWRANGTALRQQSPWTEPLGAVLKNIFGQKGRDGAVATRCVSNTRMERPAPEPWRWWRAATEDDCSYDACAMYSAYPCPPQLLLNQECCMHPCAMLEGEEEENYKRSEKLWIPELTSLFLYPCLGALSWNCHWKWHPGRMIPSTFLIWSGFIDITEPLHESL